MSEHKTDIDFEISSSKKAKKLVTSEWGWRVLCTALLLLNLWMKTQYVGVERYDADRKEMMAAIKALSDAQIEQRKQADTNSRTEKQLDDHEERIRKIERAIK